MWGLISGLECVALQSYLLFYLSLIFPFLSTRFIVPKTLYTQKVRNICVIFIFHFPFISFWFSEFTTLYFYCCVFIFDSESLSILLSVYESVSKAGLFSTHIPIPKTRAPPAIRYNIFLKLVSKVSLFQKVQIYNIDYFFCFFPYFKWVCPMYFNKILIFSELPSPVTPPKPAVSIVASPPKSEPDDVKPFSG